MLKLFIGSIMTSSLAVIAASIANPAGLGPEPIRGLVWAALILCILPSAAIVLTATAINAIRPRRLFDATHRGASARLTLGLLCGFLAAALGGIGIALAPERIPEGLAPLAAAITVSLIATLCLPALRAGHCRCCGYDLTGPTPPDNCPECNTPRQQHHSHVFGPERTAECGHG